MINMIKAELYRLTKSKGIYIFWILTAAVYGIAIAIREEGGIFLGAALDDPQLLTAVRKLDILQMSSNFTFYYLLLMPVFVVIASEFSEHTIKNAITSSISKGQYFIYKFVFALIFSLICFTAANYLFYIVNRLVNGDDFSSPIGEFSKAFFMQLPMFAAIISAFIFIAFFLKKGAAFNAVTMIFPFAYTMVGSVMIGIEGSKKAGEALMKHDLSVMIKGLTLGVSNSTRNEYYIICAVVTVVSFTLGYLSFTKSEINS